MERKLYLIQDLAYPQQSYLELSDSEVKVIEYLVEEGYVSSDLEIICLTDKEYQKFE